MQLLPARFIINPLRYLLPVEGKKRAPKSSLIIHFCAYPLQSWYYFGSMEASTFFTLNLKSRVVRPNCFNQAILSSFLRRLRIGSSCSSPNFTVYYLKKPSRSHFLGSCHGTREESGGPLTGESILQNEQTLERELQKAIQQENYVEAAKIRDSLKLLQEDSKVSVLAANAKFYNSFRNGDLAAMQALWSKGEHVCVVHPGVSGISGNDLVMGSWEFVWADYEFPLEIETKDVQVHVRGDLGYVTCIEMVKTKGSSWGRHFATNVFEKVDGHWFICIHHASYVDL